MCLFYAIKIINNTYELKLSIKIATNDGSADNKHFQLNEQEEEEEETSCNSYGLTRDENLSWSVDTLTIERLFVIKNCVHWWKLFYVAFVWLRTNVYYLHLSTSFVITLVQI